MSHNHGKTVQIARADTATPSASRSNALKGAGSARAPWPASQFRVKPGMIRPPISMIRMTRTETAALVAWNG